MALYTSPALPAGTTDDRAVKFFSEFYRISDTPDVDDLYASQFTPDTSVAMGNKKLNGQAEVLALRKSMWITVGERRHVVHQLYPFSAGTNEYMLHGTVDYTAKNGTKSSKDWAAHAQLVEDANGELKLKLYHVYLDSAPAPAKA